MEAKKRRGFLVKFTKKWKPKNKPVFPISNFNLFADKKAISILEKKAENSRNKKAILSDAMVLLNK